MQGFLILTLVFIIDLYKLRIQLRKKFRAYGIDKGFISILRHSQSVSVETREHYNDYHKHISAFDYYEVTCLQLSPSPQTRNCAALRTSGPPKISTTHKSAGTCRTLSPLFTQNCLTPQYPADHLIKMPRQTDPQRVVVDWRCPPSSIVYKMPLQ